MEFCFENLSAGDIFGFREPVRDISRITIYGDVFIKTNISRRNEKFPIVRCFCEAVNLKTGEVRSVARNEKVWKYDWKWDLKCNFTI